MASVAIISTLWGVIGWNVAGSYAGMEKWYGKLIVSIVFILFIILIERTIIHSHGNIRWQRAFRIFLGLLMAFIGSTIFDQIFFGHDVEVRMKEIRSGQIDREIPVRSKLLDEEISGLVRVCDSVERYNMSLYEEIGKRPNIVTFDVSSTTRQVGMDDSGKPVTERDRTVTRRSTVNPAVELAQRNHLLLKDY
ncbi:MAG: DUF4407 domain-containing protein [Rikenellaceae bacterium]|nr:DUF4407 domain-containing protein [Rikenellaceae bacterium]